MDLQLVKKALRGDDDLFVQLIMEKKEKLIRIAYKYCLDDAMVEDVLSETIYQCYKHRKQCKDVQYFDTWLIRILINNCIKEIKSQGKHVELVVDVEDGKSSDVSLRSIVYSLDEPERSILIFHFFENATLSEIAQYLQMPLSTVKSKYYKVLNALKIELEEVYNG
ncbi:MAG: sigma-70 family RNA polymerase sigma factor [Erysipelotrichaceae bacterium]|nr:sigma-70 family RNA polymerase sigma factor [Erysipelotrichaceae bacterium]